MSYKLKM